MRGEGADEPEVEVFKLEAMERFVQGVGRAVHVRLPELRGDEEL